MLIGLIGQKRVGKDTVASIIKEYDNEYMSYALADPIKDIARIMFNFSESQLFDSEKDMIDTKWGIKPRDFFEKFGTDIMQFDIYKYLPALQDKVPTRLFWVKSLINKIQSANHSKIIITDIRGLHELETIKQAYPDAIFIKLSRPVLSLDEETDKFLMNTHITQIEPNLIDASYYTNEIINDGTLEELKIKVKKILEKYAPSNAPSNG